MCRHSFNNGELQVDFNDIQLDDANIIGDGGSCIVYKTSVFGKICAVKVLAVNASEWDEEQFDSEVKRYIFTCTIALYCISTLSLELCSCR